MRKRRKKQPFPHPNSQARESVCRRAFGCDCVCRFLAFFLKFSNIHSSRTVHSHCAACQQRFRFLVYVACGCVSERAWENFKQAFWAKWKWLKTLYAMVYSFVGNVSDRDEHMVLKVTLKQFRYSTCSYWYWKFLLSTIHTTRGFIVCVCACVRRNWRKWRKENDIRKEREREWVFSLVESYGNVRKIVAWYAFVCMAWNVVYTRHMHTTTQESVCFVNFSTLCDARAFGIYFPLCYSLSFALSLRIFSLATRKIQWFSNCGHLCTAMKTKEHAFGCVSISFVFKWN